ncbi:hypothetical protein AcV5_004546 [Taiwanofungus camphoratus]|nr:hypothetical protein AcW2_000857 [Antrodia cinnamomea]KAI0936395.1 hypothetical protein AcV5_004546 [Antrodia cinnamomea]KAI0961606.1 hypothetical protein AcV7_000665 [Antrodia cinnamomea]
MEPSIVVNDFMVCKRHGDEYCVRCFCDYRMTNNVGHNLDNSLAELVNDTGFDLDERQPRNVYNLGAVRVGRGSEDYKCKSHNQKDCGTCFDWVSIVRREVQDARAQER